MAKRTWMMCAAPAALAAGTITTVAAHAATEAPASGGEIVVTAQKRSEKLQDVPIAVSAITGEAIANKRVADLVDLSNQAPGLQISSGDNAANPHIFLRGVGVNDFNQTTASAVGIYSDGAYIASPLAQRSAFFDLQQVEVLRGPQGTLYGRNTTGGAINLVSRKPTDTWAANLNVDYGRFNALKTEGGVSGPIVPGVLSFRLAAVRETDDGYMLNRLTGQHVNATNHWASRLSLHFTPSSTVTDDFVFTADHSQGDSIITYNRTTMAADGSTCTSGFTSGACTNVLGYANTSSNLYEGDYRFIGKDRVRYYGGVNTLAIDLGGAALTSVTAYQHSRRDDVEETDANPLPVLDAHYVSGQETFSQELRLGSTGPGPLHYVAGVYYAHDHISNASQYNLPFADVSYAWPYTQSTDSYAVFGQADYAVTEALTLIGGLRWSSDRKKFHYDSLELVSDSTFFTLDATRTFSSVSARAGLQYKITPRLNVYASYNRGTKSGGFFGGQTTDLRDIGPYKDETINAYEAGLKSEWFGRKLTANLSTFYYDYQNLQVYTMVQREPLDAQVFTNASAARMFGAEVELSARPVRGLNLMLNAAWLDAKYRHFISVEAASDYSGNTLPYAPKFSLQADANYERDLGPASVIADLSLSHRSKIFFDTTNVARISDPGRTYVDGRLGFKLGAARKLEIGGWIKNIFDVTNIGLISPLPSLGYDAYTMNPPRTYGAYLRVAL